MVIDDGDDNDIIDIRIIINIIIIFVITVMTEMVMRISISGISSRKYVRKDSGWSCVSPLAFRGARAECPQASPPSVSKVTPSTPLSPFPSPLPAATFLSPSPSPLQDCCSCRTPECIEERRYLPLAAER